MSHVHRIMLRRLLTGPSVIGMVLPLTTDGSRLPLSTQTDFAKPVCVLTHRIVNLPALIDRAHIHGCDLLLE